MTRDEAIDIIATTTVLDHDTARRCVEIMPNVSAQRAVRIATEASIIAQYGGEAMAAVVSAALGRSVDPDRVTVVELCALAGLALAVARFQADQMIARMATDPRSVIRITGV